MEAFDPRITPARPDLADLSLEGVVPAARYAPSRLLQCARPSTAIRSAPDSASEQVDQLLYGELFSALETRRGFVWGQARRDGYVGWVEASALADEVSEPTHRVAALRTYALSRPDVKAPGPVALSMNAMIAAAERKGRFVRDARLGWIVADHLAGLDVFETDPAAVAERFVGAPYQWGGRESEGLDCSGLVQQALFACGRGCPRDADMQEREAGSPIDPGRSFANLKRGDLVFWRDHVGVMADSRRIVHADAFHMRVEIEALETAAERRKAAGGGAPTAFRRL